MNIYKYDEKRKENQGILSATPPKNILNTELQQNIQLQTKVRQKKKIVIYIIENKYYVDHSTAYALGMVNTRAIMLEKPKLIEINYDTHNILKNNKEFEIEYIVQKLEKPKLKVFISDSTYCIENSAAFALGLLSIEEFNSAVSNYYYISEEFLTKLKENYQIEIYSKNLYEENNNKKL